MSSFLVFNRVCTMEIQSVKFGTFDRFVNYCPSNLLSGYLPPLPPFPVWISIIVYTYSVCKGGSMGSQEGRGPRTGKTPAAKSLYRSIFLDNGIWHCILRLKCSLFPICWINMAAWWCSPCCCWWRMLTTILPSSSSLRPQSQSRYQEPTSLNIMAGVIRSNLFFVVEQTIV